MGDKKKEFSFEFFNYKSKDSGLFGILLTRFFATAVKKLLRWFEIVRSSVIKKKLNNLIPFNVFCIFFKSLWVKIENIFSFALCG